MDRTMETMSWSDDTRCLYCEGRLPLYRKITHGQFCSNAHRKAYWEEQERLAVERLHQSHNSLRAYRSPVPEELLPKLSLPTFESPSIPLPAASVVEEAPFAVPDLRGCLWPEVSATIGRSPDAISAEPFEYEIACYPLTPLPVWSAAEAILRAGSASSWTPLSPQTCVHHVRGGEVLAELPEELALRYPWSATLAAKMRTAGRTAVPLSAGPSRERAAASAEWTAQSLDLTPSPITYVALHVSPQGDLLVEMFDRQVPRPESLLALNLFVARQPLPAAAAIHFDAELDAPPQKWMPEAAIATVTPDYQLAFAGLRAVPRLLASVPGANSSKAASCEAVDTQPAIYWAAMPAGEEVAYQVGSAGLQRLSSAWLHAASGVCALQGNDPSCVDLRTQRSADIAFPVLALHTSVETGKTSDELESQVGTAGLQKLNWSLLRPAQGIPAPRTAGTLTWDLSAGVSSDITLPSQTPAAAAAAPRAARILPLKFVESKPLASRPEPIARLIPQAAEPHPLLPNSGLEPMDRKPPEDALRAKGSGLGSLVSGEGLRKLEPVWEHATGFWQHAPRDLKLLLFAIPALLALVFHPGLPRVAFAAPQSSGGFSGSFKRVLNDQFVSVRQTLENRAAIALDEDFRSGLDNWASPKGSTTEWSFDATGFVRPGPLALYRPSVNLVDYQAQFMGTIDKKALSWVVRAADFENFYVIKLVVVKPGPIPTIGLTRYAVIGGKAQDRHDVNIPISARADTLYSIRMNVQGSNFSVEVQGQMADSWTETRLPRGGVGFFTARGEESRVRWVQITHQYDMLGRLCAYLAPYDTSNGSWQP